MMIGQVTEIKGLLTRGPETLHISGQESMRSTELIRRTEPRVLILETTIEILAPTQGPEMTFLVIEGPTNLDRTEMTVLTHTEVASTIDLTETRWIFIAIFLN